MTQTHRPHSPTSPEEAEPRDVDAIAHALAAGRVQRSTTERPTADALFERVALLHATRHPNRPAFIDLEDRDPRGQDVASPPRATLHFLKAQRIAQYCAIYQETYGGYARLFPPALKRRDRQALVAPDACDLPLVDYDGLGRYQTIILWLDHDAAGVWLDLADDAPNAPDGQEEAVDVAYFRALLGGALTGIEAHTHAWRLAPAPETETASAGFLAWLKAQWEALLSSLTPQLIAPAAVAALVTLIVVRWPGSPGPGPTPGPAPTPNYSIRANPIPTHLAATARLYALVGQRWQKVRTVPSYAAGQAPQPPPPLCNDTERLQVDVSGSGHGALALWHISDQGAIEQLNIIENAIVSRTTQPLPRLFTAEDTPPSKAVRIHIEDLPGERHTFAVSLTHTPPDPNRTQWLLDALSGGNDDVLVRFISCQERG